jgi:UDP-N-acetylmuramoylalanine--D-glutamate ligase
MRDELFGKRVVILGAARQGLALARFAVDVGAKVVLSDLRPAESLATGLNEVADIPMEMVLGDHPMSLLEDADIVAVSGGVPLELPLLQAARKRDIPVTNDSFEFMKRAKAPIVGITGSAGKTTTTALTGKMTEQAGRRTWIGGNIGRPLISNLTEIEEGDVIVQELSSFQLELWRKSPHVAAVLNLTQNHLDRHKTMDAYRKAKANILRYQGGQDIAILSADDPGAMSMKEEVHCRLRTFSLHQEVEDGSFVRDKEIWKRDGQTEEKVGNLNSIKLRGSHNILNVLASVILADSVGIPRDAIASAIASFTGVEHRLELVRTIRGVQFVNDSIATAPERVLAAIDSFTEPLILLAGGQDKDMKWEEWALQVIKRVKSIVLFGELADDLNSFLMQAKKSKTKPLIACTNSLDEAIKTATRLSTAGDVVLLSPGGTSFDAFVDFSERGDVFRRLVMEIPGEETSE